MVDYSKFIQEALDAGTNVDDIVFKFTAALNEIVDKQEQEKKKATKKQDWLNDIWDDFAEAWGIGGVEIAHIAGLATTFVADEHPEWDLATCKEFYDYMKFAMTEGAKMFGKPIHEQLNECMRNVIDNIKPVIKTKQETITDEEKVTKFLEQIFGK